LLDEQTAGKAHVADVSKALTLQLKKARVFMAGRPLVLACVNEARDNFDSGWGGGFAPTTKMPHGRALKHFASTILRAGRVKTLNKTIKKRKVNTGCHIELVAQKARLGVPGRKAKIVLSFSREPSEGGPHPARSNFLFLKENGLLKPRGSKGVTIADMADTVGIFKENEFGDVMQEHRTAIKRLLKSELSADVALDRDG
jgi:hypothetical protein